MESQLAPRLNQALLGRWEPLYRSQLHYLVTWSTRGRKPVLKDRHVEHLVQVIPSLCEERSVALLELVVGSDHVHVLFGLRPTHSVASAVREIKGRSAMTLMADHPELRVWLGGNLLWDERYAVETVSPARLNKVRTRLRVTHGNPDQLAEAS